MVGVRQADFDPKDQIGSFLLGLDIARRKLSLGLNEGNGPLKELPWISVYPDLGRLAYLDPANRCFGQVDDQVHRLNVAEFQQGGARFSQLPWIDRFVAY